MAMLKMAAKCTMACFLSAVALVSGHVAPSPASVSALRPTLGLLGLRSSSLCMSDTPPSPSDPPAEANDARPPSVRSASLEEKMKTWEASEAEIKAATLGGLVPGKIDGFELGLNIVFPIMLVSCVFIALFPLFMGSIDVSSVGPPPTQ